MAAAVLAIPSAWTPARAQSAPAFDVTSVKLNTSGPDAGIRFQPLPGRLTMTNTTLRIVAAWAYGVQFFQLVGGPGWVDTARFDILAKAEGNPSTTEMRRMLRGLLEDRFKLTRHQESREMPVYALTAIRKGAEAGRVKSSDIDCAATPAVGAKACEFTVRLGNVHARGMSIASLAETLSGTTGRIVIDRTEVTGPVDFDLTWTPEPFRGRAPAGGEQTFLVNGASVDPNGPSLFTALEEQLGLKLESTKGPVEVLVIDGAEKPTDD
jgi:uncharacterized protein (TIGR03435 family)